MTLMFVCESDGEEIAGWGKKALSHCFLLLLFIFIPQAFTRKLSVSVAATQCRLQLHVLAMKHSVSQLVRAQLSSTVREIMHG